MRGKVLSHLPSIVNKGITPAYAGKSPCCRRSCPCTRDHPRLCGEKSCNSPASVFAMGSPPPMRGKDAGTARAHTVRRITPAYAGKRLLLPPACFLGWDHPRLCGEKLIPIEFGGIKTGSPPPMRGKAALAYAEAFLLRITPAYAGKRLYKMTDFFLYTDHPRLCGEKQPRRFSCLHHAGSPPPMRGKVQKLRRSFS